MADRDERTIHRLEAFSDIVIGFCMAELGFNLVIPKDAAGLASSWGSLNVFAFSFVLISLVWWWHHKLFLTYFHTRPATIVMNFVLLGSLVYCIYFQQVAIRFAATGVDVTLPVRLWLACMALTFAQLAGMYAIGIWERRCDLDNRAMRWGVSVTYETTLSCIGLAVVGALIPHHEAGAVITILIVVLAATLRGPIASRFTRLLLPVR
jgi:Endosomal/lysosomal potassium channel TMEM175